MPNSLLDGCWSRSVRFGVAFSLLHPFSSVSLQPDLGIIFIALAVFCPQSLRLKNPMDVEENSRVRSSSWLLSVLSILCQLPHGDLPADMEMRMMDLMESGSVIPGQSRAFLVPSCIDRYRTVIYQTNTIQREAWPSYCKWYSVGPPSQSSSWDSLPRTLEGRHPWTVDYRTVGKWAVMEYSPPPQYCMVR